LGPSIFVFKIVLAYIDFVSSENSVISSNARIANNRMRVRIPSPPLKASPAGEVWRAGYNKHFPHGVLGAEPLPALEFVFDFACS
jgi:hypothetical protein